MKFSKLILFIMIGFFSINFSSIKAYAAEDVTDNQNQGSSIEQSTIEQSTIEQSTIEQSNIEKSSVDQSTIGQSTVEQSTVEQSTVEQSTIGQSTVEQSTIGQSTIEQSTIEQSTIEQNSIEQSTIENSSVDQSSIDQSTVDQSSVEENPVEENPVEEAIDNKETSKVVEAETIKYTKAELRLLSALIYCEAQGESYNGKLAVGIVVMNRVRSDRYSNTLKGVIYQKYQFSPVTSGTLKKTLSEYDKGNFTSSAEKECIKAAKAALNGTKSITVKGIKKSFSKYLSFSGRLRGYTFQLGNHQFK